jgi:hypothetical protein
MSTSPVDPQQSADHESPRETQELALKPLIYVLILPITLLVIMQVTGLPAYVVRLVTGH